MNILKGSSVFLSVKGHRGFFYPGEKESTILYDTSLEKVSWVGGGERFTPIVVPENAIFISGNPRRRIPVWVCNEN